MTIIKDQNWIKSNNTPQQLLKAAEEARLLGDKYLGFDVKGDGNCGFHTMVLAKLLMSKNGAFKPEGFAKNYLKNDKVESGHALRQMLFEYLKHSRLSIFVPTEKYPDENKFYSALKNNNTGLLKYLYERLKNGDYTTHPILKYFKYNPKNTTNIPEFSELTCSLPQKPYSELSDSNKIVYQFLEVLNFIHDGCRELIYEDYLKQGYTKQRAKEYAENAYPEETELFEHVRTDSHSELFNILRRVSCGIKDFSNNKTYVTRDNYCSAIEIGMIASILGVNIAYKGIDRGVVQEKANFFFDKNNKNYFEVRIENSHAKLFVPLDNTNIFPSQKLENLSDSVYIVGAAEVLEEKNDIEANKSKSWISRFLQGTKDFITGKTTDDKPTSSEAKFAATETSGENFSDSGAPDNSPKEPSSESTDGSEDKQKDLIIKRYYALKEEQEQITPGVLSKEQITYKTHNELLMKAGRYSSIIAHKAGVYHEDLHSDYNSKIAGVGYASGSNGYGDKIASSDLD